MRAYEFDEDGNIMLRADAGEQFCIGLDEEEQRLLIQYMLKGRCPFCHISISEEDMLCEQCLSRAREVRARRHW